MSAYSWAAAAAAALMMAVGLAARAGIDPDAAQKLYDRVVPSIVAVTYTVESEAGRDERSGQGVVIDPEGIVMLSMQLFPPSTPDEQMKDFKVVIPGDQEQEFEAVFLGRDERSELAFVKTKQKQSWPAIKFEAVPLRIGEPVASIGLLPKSAAYKAFYAEAQVAALIRGTAPLVMVTPPGLAALGAPVFNADGKAVGYVSLIGSQQAPARLFVPASDFLPSLSDLPTGEPLKLPWLGAPLAPVRRDVAEYYDLKNKPVAQIGDVIPDGPAAKAGLRANDKIVALDGKPLERGDDLEDTYRILGRKIRRMKVGQVITLSVLREKGKDPVDVKVTLEEQPRRENLAKRYFAEDLGLVVREIVFNDTYVKKVAADTKGVVVAFIRPGSSAASARLRPNDIVTEINKEPVADLESFKSALQKFREANPKDPVVLVVLRERGTEVIKIEPPQ